MTTKKQNDQYDPGWKGIIKGYFPDFMAFYYPGLAAQINWEKEVSFLSEQMQQISKDSEEGTRIVDCLVKVWLKSGEEAWLLIHIEVQSETDKLLPKRIFVYNYRAYDLFNIPVISLAILGDMNKLWHPKSFEYGLLECKTQMSFEAVKLRDYLDKWQELEGSDNPFAIVTMAHLKAKQTKNKHGERYHWRLTLIRMLFRKGWDRQRVLDLFEFISYVMTLPKELDKRLTETLTLEQRGEDMKYATTFLREAYENSKIETMKKLLSDLIRTKFGNIPDWANEKINQADNSLLEDWCHKLVLKDDLEEIFT